MESADKSSAQTIERRAAAELAREPAPAGLGDTASLWAASPRGTAQRHAMAGLQRPPAPVVQRLTVENTAWGTATEAKVTAGSGQGVAIISDGAEPVVVKGNQGWGNEVVVISSLMNAVMGSNAGNDQLADAEYARAVTSRARVASAAEIATIAQVVTNLAPAIADDPNRKGKVIADINNPPTLVYSYVPGKDYKDILAEYGSGDRKVSKKKRLGKGRIARSGNNPIAQLWKDPGQMQMLGKASAVDIVSGNGDRLLRYFNPANFRLDEAGQQVVLIDNVAKSGEVFLGDNAAFNVTGAGSFGDWLKLSFVASFIQGDDSAVADRALSKFTENFEDEMRDEDQNFVRQSLQNSLPGMKGWFMQGLAAGRAGLRAASNSMDAYVSGIPDGQKQEFKINLLCRLLAVELHFPDYDGLRDIAKSRLGIL